MGSLDESVDESLYARVHKRILAACELCCHLGFECLENNLAELARIPFAGFGPSTLKSDMPVQAIALILFQFVCYGF